MKLWKRLLSWVLISLILQLTVLWFIDGIYLKNRGKIIEVTKYEEKEMSPVSGNITIPENISDLKFSSTCHYAAYLTDGGIQIVDLFGTKASRLIKKDDMEVLYYKWLQDRNMVIYAFVDDMKLKNVISVETYDVETGITREYPHINQGNSDIEVFGIEPSSLTNSVYVILKANDGEISLYKYDIVENLSYIATFDAIAAAYHLIYTDGLILQNKQNQIFIIDGSSKSKYLDYKLKEKPFLLGTDASGLAYIGNMDEEQYINEIVVLKTTDPNVPVIKRIKLNESILRRNIRLTPEGGVFALDMAENSIYDILNKTSFKYPGDFIQATGGYIISLENKKLNFTRLPILH